MLWLGTMDFQDLGGGNKSIRRLKHLFMLFGWLWPFQQSLGSLFGVILRYHLSLGEASYPSMLYRSSANSEIRATVVSLYSSYAIPILLRITYAYNSFKPGYFRLGRWSRLIGSIAVLWAVFVGVVLLFPLNPNIKSSADMSEFIIRGVLLSFSDRRVKYSPDYAVVIVLAVFLLSALSWITSARKWFHGPVPNITREEVDRATDQAGAEMLEGGEVYEKRSSLEEKERF